MIDAGETIDVSPRNSDLSRMVRWIDADKDIKYKNVRLPSPQTQKPILIIHDSFFGRARNTLMQSLNKSMRMVHIRDFSKTVDQIPPGTLVLVNSVERSLFQRFQFNAQSSGEVNFLEPAILKSNATEANKCSYSGEMNETVIRFYDIQKAGQNSLSDEIQEQFFKFRRLSIAVRPAWKYLIFGPRKRQTILSSFSYRVPEILKQDISSKLAPSTKTAGLPSELFCRVIILRNNCVMTLDAAAHPISRTCG